MIGLYQYHGTFAWSWWTCWFAERAALQGNATLSQDVVKTPNDLLGETLSLLGRMELPLKIAFRAAKAC